MNSYLSVDYKIAHNNKATKKKFTNGRANNRNNTHCFGPKIDNKFLMVADEKLDTKQRIPFLIRTYLR